MFSPQEEDYEDDLEVETPTPTPTHGTNTPLAFPAHNGSGSFLDQLNRSVAAAATDSSPLSSATMDRINAWRINQSQHILNEFTRLEKRNRRKSQSVAVSQSTTSSSETVDSTLSSWGLPEDEDDEDYLMHSHDRIAVALGDDSLPESGPGTSSSLSSRSALAVSIIAKELSSILGTKTSYEAAVRLILTAAENASHSYHQDALDQALNAILDPSLSLNTAHSSRAYTSTGANTPTPATVAANAQMSKDQQTFWQFITTKVLYDFIGLNDEILEVILGERFIDPDASTVVNEDLERSVSQGIYECRQAHSYSEYGNYIKTPTPSPPAQSYMKMLASNSKPKPVQNSGRRLSNNLVSVLTQGRTAASKSELKSPSQSQHLARSSSSLALHELLRSRLAGQFSEDRPSDQQQYADDALSVTSSSKRFAAIARSQASAKRARCLVGSEPSEAGESNYWEMSSGASGNGSDVGNLIGVS